MALTATEELPIEQAANRAAVMTTLGRWYVPIGTDADAVQNAIDAAHDAGGGVVRLLPGVTYTIRNVELKSLVIIEAYGAIIQHGGSNGTVAPLESVPATLYGEGSEEDPLYGCAILGGRWIGLRTGTSYYNTPTGAEDLLQFNHCPGIVIRDATFEDCRQDGITVANSPGAKVVNNHFARIADAAVEIRLGGGVLVSGNSMDTVRHLVASKSNNHDIQVIGNRGTSFEKGIFGHGSRWSILGNVIGVAGPVDTSPETDDAKDGVNYPGIASTNSGDPGGSVGGAVQNISDWVIANNTITGRSNSNGIYLTNASTYSFDRVTITGNTISCRRAILIERGRGVTISGNTLDGTSAPAIQITTAEVTKPVITGNIISGSPASGTGVVDLVTPRAVIADNTIETTSSGALGIRLTSAAVRARITGNDISVGAANGIVQNAANGNISGNTVTTTTGAAIDVAGDGNVIGGNNLAPVGGEGVLVRAGRVVVSANTITSGTQGVRVGAGGSGAAASNSIVTGNTITGCQFWGVNVTSGCVSAIVANNNLLGNTSGAITDAGTTTVTANNVTA